ncbi:hypothetical protein KCP75_19965 [Salmonella enterica subsp. enterica]|nr:hypothetical protein KCP75_19965 [Salmonella enterica subsp. enterica]
MGVDPQPPAKEQDVFERGIINVRRVAVSTKPQSFCYFGKKIIVNNLRSMTGWGCQPELGLATRPTADLERILTC